MQSSKTEDPCADFGAIQRNAVIWFIACIAIGIFICVKCANIDSWMYHSNAETLDYSAYRENRLATFTLPSEATDKRTAQSIASVTRRLKKDN
ncbi:MAG: hypothetical protein IT291_02560 [Deltaproteobacteria bacterium]|nr:hypothetical protein [Deltaproteobacteria bacterium]